MTPPPAAAKGPGPGSGFDPDELVSSATEQLATITTLAALEDLHTDLLGKRSALARAHQGLVALEPGDSVKHGEVVAVEEVSHREQHLGARGTQHVAGFLAETILQDANPSLVLVELPQAATSTARGANRAIRATTSRADGHAWAALSMRIRCCAPLPARAQRNRS